MSVLGRCCRTSRAWPWHTKARARHFCLIISPTESRFWMNGQNPPKIWLFSRLVLSQPSRRAVSSATYNPNWRQVCDKYTHVCNRARSHALANTQWNISQLTGSWIAYCDNDRSKLMDPHSNTRITSHCSQLGLVDEWLQVVYGIRRRLLLPIIERERRQNVSCAAGIRMSWDKGLWGRAAMWETRGG